MTSYETCGNVDTYSEAKVLETIQGAHLRISFYVLVVLQFNVIFLLPAVLQLQ